jgi:hypothetical protein
LENIKASSDENFQLFSCRSGEEMISNVQHLGSELENKSQFPKSLRDFTNVFCQTAEQVFGIVDQLLPQTPEYTMTFGVLYLLFQATVNKRKQQELLTGHLQALKQTLPLCEFYREVFPTNQMKMTLARMYVHVLGFLEEAVIYYRSGRLGKLVDAVMLSGEDRFAQHIALITAQAEKLRELRDAGHVAQQSDMKTLLGNTSEVVGHLYEGFEDFATAIGASLMVLDQKSHDLEQKMSIILIAEASQYSHKLADIILPDAIDYWDDNVAMFDQHARLSPKDKWENNGVLDMLPFHTGQSRENLIWIGGSSGYSKTWVTDFSMDLVQALRPHSPAVLYAFSHASRGISLVRLLRNLVFQVLTKHPTVAYQNTSLLNPRCCRQADTFDQLWLLLEGLLRHLSANSIYLVLDRLELYEPQKEVEHLLVPALINLARSMHNISIFVTSVYEPPAELKSKMFSLYIDTGKAPRQRGR